MTMATPGSGRGWGLTRLRTSPAEDSAAASWGLGDLAGPPLTDAGFTVVLTVLVLAELGTSYDGSQYLLVGVLAALLGIGIAGLARLSRLPVLLTAVGVVLAFVLLGPVLSLRADQSAGPLPGPASLSALWTTLVHGWKQLLTTLPPVNGSGRLLVLPMVIGLLLGSAGFAVARLSSRSLAAVGVPAAGLAATILLGTVDGRRSTVLGLAFGTVALGWTALRTQRRVVQTPGGRGNRLATGVGLLAATVAVVALLSPVLPLAGSRPVVLRASVRAPVELGDYPSPLVGFRRYTPAAKNLADRLLFTEQGLPSGTPMRLATLADYAGTAWTASAGGPESPSGTFSRVGARIPTSIAGTSATYTVTIAAGYAESADSAVWLPGAGLLTRVTFGGADRSAHSEALRYNLATASALVSDGLRAGDTYTAGAVLPDQRVPASLTPIGEPELSADRYSFVSRYALSWGGSTGEPWQRLLAIVKHLHDTGAYTDGGPGEASFLPGHSVGRLTRFLSAPQVAGDDEQYAASLALMANYLGLPARVVFGAIPEPDGSVRGRDVHAWIEVHAATGDWIALPTSAFVPSSDRKPTKQQQQQQADANSAVVPPPNSIRPPSSLEQFSQADSSSSRSRTAQPQHLVHRELPRWLRLLLWEVLAPLGTLLVLAAAVLMAKSLRRWSRRNRGGTYAQILSGWREVLDYARDLGERVERGRTRQEQVALLPSFPLAQLAASTDAAAFGPAVAPAFLAAEQWEAVVRVRREMALSVSRRRRWWAALNPRSLIPEVHRSPSGSGAGSSASAPRSAPDPGPLSMSPSAIHARHAGGLAQLPPLPGV